MAKKPRKSFGVDGIICIHKPQEYTSFDVVARLRGMTKIKRVGHAGTLDPMATGVLPVFVGMATKACDILPNDDKRYTASFRLGVTTNTQDSTGIVETTTQSHITPAQLLEVLPNFRGEIDQLPPMFSAVQINGQRLYDLARQGLEVDRKTRKITIFKLDLLSFDEQTQEGTIDVVCSKGTYIRTICHDIGAQLGVGGIMTDLVRTEAAGFTLADCITMEQAQSLTSEGRLLDKLLPIARVFESYPKIKLNQVQSEKFFNGVRLDLNRVIYQKLDGFHTVYSFEDKFLGLASLDFEGMELKIEKMFAERD